MGYIEKPFRPHSFNKWLELASRRHAARVAEEASSVPPRIYRVLVVGDEEPSRSLRTGLEATRRFKVETAYTVPSALATVQARPPDLILLDFMARSIDGLEVCRSLKTDARTAGVPVIHYSETGGAEGQSRAEQAGAGCFLTTPAAPRVVALELLARLEGDPLLGPRGDT
jgi:CheY-like chemotaxis protein